MKSLVKKIAIPALCLLAFLAIPLSAFADHSGLAIVLIDMQPGFYQRGDVEKSMGLGRLLVNQRTLLEWAKKKDIPVLVFEYLSFLDTDSRLMKIITNNTYKVITKVSDDGFSANSESRAQAIEILKLWKVDTIIVAGINGPYCVKGTITGAMSAGFNVITSSDLVGDINQNPPVFPNGTWIFNDQRLSVYKSLDEMIK